MVVIRRERARDPLTGRRIHPYIPEIAGDLASGRVGRRDFLRTATLLGMGAASAYYLASRAMGRPVFPEARAASAAAKRGGVLRVSMPVKSLADPAHWEDMSGQVRWILEYLTIPGPDNVTRPYLAESWEASEDLRTWTFHLRRGVTWSNGDDFIADDVVHNFERWLDPAIGSSNIGLFSSMTRDGTMIPGAVEKLDDHTVRLNLDTPELAIPEALYNYSTAIVHRRFDEWGANLLKTPVGTAPFALERYEVGQVCVLRRREAPHWMGAPYLDGIETIDHGEHPGAAIAALASDQVDMVHDVDLSLLEALEELPNVVLHKAMTAQTAVARMRVSAPPFDDRRVRQAVCASMDHERILELALRGHGLPAENHHVAPIHPAYAELPPLKPDPERARHLLAEAGYPDGIDLEIDVANTLSWHLNAVQAFRQQLLPAGIRLEINVMPGQRYWDIWDKTPFGFTSWMHRPLGTQTLNLAYRSGMPWNETGYSNPEFDATLDTAMGILDPGARRVHMRKLQSMLQDDAVIAQPLWRPLCVATRNTVRDYEILPTLHHRLERVWLDR